MLYHTDVTFAAAVLTDPEFLRYVIWTSADVALLPTGIEKWQYDM